MQARPPRPLGVTILAVLSILIGIVTIVIGIAALGIAAVSSIPAQSGIGAGYVAAFGAFTLIVGILGLAVGVGFLHGRPYGWILGMIVSVLMVIDAIVMIALGNISSVVQLLIYLGIIFYLTRPHVKAYFGRASSVVTPMAGTPTGVPGPTMMGSSMGGGMGGTGSTMATMRCSNCGANVQTGSMKCPSCGANL